MKIILLLGAIGLYAGAIVKTGTETSTSAWVWTLDFFLCLGASIALAAAIVYLLEDRRLYD